MCYNREGQDKARLMSRVIWKQQEMLCVQICRTHCVQTAHRSGSFRRWSSLRGPLCSCTKAPALSVRDQSSVADAIARFDYCPSKDS